MDPTEYSEPQLEHDLAIEAEQSVLGSMLIDSKVVPIVMPELAPEDFGVYRNQQIYGAIRSMTQAGKSREVDPVTVLDQLRQTVAADDMPLLRSYVLQLMDTTPTAANVREYIEIVKERARVRRLHEVGAKLMHVDTSDQGVPLLQEGETVLTARGAAKKGMTMEDCLLHFYDSLKSPPGYLPTGFKFLDKMAYMARGDFNVIAARPSCGKTALALQMAYLQAAPAKPGAIQHKVGFYSLETSELKLTHRLLAQVAEIPTEVIKKAYRRLDDGEENLDEARLPPWAYQKIADHAYDMTAHQLQLIPAAGWTVDEIRAHALAEGFDVVYIDYLQLIQGRAGVRYQNDTARVGEISRQLALMAHAKGGPAIFALSQLKRLESGRTEPYTSDLRESGQIEQDAETILMLWRDEETSDAQRYMKLGKNKDGQLARWPMVFDGPYMRFDTEQSGQYDDDEEYEYSDDDDPGR